MKENKYRNNYCGTLTDNDNNLTVKLSGWVENIRDHGGVIFVDLRDEKGVIQLVSNNNSIFDDITRESTISVEGQIRMRAEEDYNDHLATGKIEVVVEKLEVLGKANNILPFEIITSHEVNEETRLKYRYLDLRNKKCHDNVVFRSKILKYIRQKMDDLEFTEIQTPILTSSSPEGARDFIVPSRKYHGKFYALPQAPQLFKQLLMVSGFDKYYQIAPCFRDEDGRSDRIYGEFYQLDFEMSFATEEDVLKIGEEIFNNIFQKFGNKKISSKPFRRISYLESINKYGTDKPDLRNPLEIIDVTTVFKNTAFKPFKDTTIKAIKVDNVAEKSNSWFNELVDYAKTIGMPGIGYFKVLDDLTFAGPIDKFLSEEERKQLIKEADLKAGSVIFFIADRKNASKFSGLIRQELGKKLDLIDKNKFEFCIINDFPMYEYDDEKKAYIFSHNPFSMPQSSLKDLTKENIANILAYQFDFVCNGIELASGAVRNHDINIMKKAFELAGYTENDLKQKFGSLYTAFQYGAPPHAGMAPGIDRMIMLLTDEESIRETIAFPMSSSGQDLMMGSPCDVTETQLREVHIKIR